MQDVPTDLGARIIRAAQLSLLLHMESLRLAREGLWTSGTECTIVGDASGIGGAEFFNSERPGRRQDDRGVGQCLDLDIRARESEVAARILAAIAAGHFADRDIP